MRVYIDTSVINGLLADDAPDIQEKTKRFFSRVHGHELTVYISGTVIAEIEATPDQDRRDDLLEILDRYPFRVLEVTEDALQLAQEYIVRGIIPLRSRADALHIALASVHRIEVLVSWNFKHIVKHKTRILTNAVNGEKGYGQVDLCTPEEI
jgi:predicted nucleic acid-binding protein